MSTSLSVFGWGLEEKVEQKIDDGGNDEINKIAVAKRKKKKNYQKDGAILSEDVLPLGGFVYG